MSGAWYGGGRPAVGQLGKAARRLEMATPDWAWDFVSAGSAWQVNRNLVLTWRSVPLLGIGAFAAGDPGQTTSRDTPEP